jgi:hypothetical protein
VSPRGSEIKKEGRNNDAPNPKLPIALRVRARWLRLRGEVKSEVGGEGKRERRGAREERNERRKERR